MKWKTYFKFSAFGLKITDVHSHEVEPDMEVFELELLQVLGDLVERRVLCTDAAA